MSVIKGNEVDHYRIDQKIGAGGMGEVYLATDDKLKRKVALKFLSSGCIVDEAMKMRFIREAQSAASLNHPNIITIHEVSEWNKQPYIVMEFVAGKSLNRILENGPPGYQASLDIIIQVCQGLQEAHAGGIIHRDIKPANIILSNAGKAKILDFGLARLENKDRLTQTGTLLGTADYMSPEQGQGNRIDERSDIFSVGTVLYEMLTGRSPFKRDNIPATIHAIVHEQPDPITLLDVDAPVDMQLILAKALAKNVDNRYQSVAEMLTDLRRLQEGVSVQPSAYPLTGDNLPKANSLAILYLRNLGSEDDEFLSYGITEDLIVDLTRIGMIRVPSMRKILKFKDTNKELEAIAEELDVDMILDGSIHKSGRIIRISAQLVDVLTGESRWAERWEESTDNLRQIKLALARGVSQALEVGSSVIKRVTVGTSETHDPQAYEYYLRGKYIHEQKKDKADSEIALGFFRKALDLEPTLLAARAGIADILVNRGENDQAHLELTEVLTATRKQKTRTDEAMVLRIMARFETGQSRWTQADECARLAQEISVELGDLVSEAKALGIRISIFEFQAKFEEALALFERILEINRQLGDQQHAAEALENMGMVHIRRGEYDRGQELTNQALEIAFKRKNKSLEALCIKNIGIAYEYMGKLDLARRQYERALQLSTELEDKKGMAANLNNTANVCSAQGSYRQALSFYQKAAAIQEKANDRGRYALSCNNISNPLTTLGQYEEAIEISRAALAIAQEVNFPLIIHDAYNALGFAHFCRGDFESAQQHFNSALETAEISDIRRGIAMTLSHLGEMYFHLGDYDVCCDTSQKALAIAEEIGEKEYQLKAAAHLMAAMIHKEPYSSVVNRLRETLNEAENHGDPRYILAVQRLLGQTQIKYGVDNSERDGGHAILKQALELAKKKEIAYEIRWIGKVLEQSKKGTIGMGTTTL